MNETELRKELFHLMPDFEWQTDSSGQIVIYTGLRVSQPGALVPFETQMELPSKVYENAPISDKIEAIVIQQCKIWALAKELPEDSVIEVLQWDSMNGCYCFMWAGMYLGVEKEDGHIHS